MTRIETVLVFCVSPLLSCALQVGSHDELSPRLRDSLEMFPDRYGDLEPEGVRDAKDKERKFAALMKKLTRDNDLVGPHGAAHQFDDGLEHELWALLKSLAAYPGAGRMILTALDEIYLGYRDNGNWGWWWHWPYFNCFKASLLVDRLEKWHQPLVEEALWTRIYCHRVHGLADTKNADLLESESMEAQFFWKADPAKVRVLCAELLQRFPNGKYATRAREILEMKDVTLTLPGHPVSGLVDPGDDATSFSTRAYDGPSFIIDRRPSAKDVK